MFYFDPEDTSGYAIDMTSTSVRIEEEALKRLKNLSGTTGMSITKLITLATSAYVLKVEAEGEIKIPVDRSVAPSAKKNGK